MYTKANRTMLRSAADADVAAGPRTGRGLPAIVAACAVLCLCAPCAFAQDKAAEPAILQLIPAETAAQRTALQSAMDGITTDEIRQLCDLLVEPGAGDDTKPRMALHALAFHAAARGRLIEVLGGAVESAQPIGVRRFLVRQLQLSADKRAVPALARLLSDDDLCDPAAQALLAIGGREAGAALLQAVANPRGNRIVIINALREFPDTSAVATLLDDSADDDRALRLAALSALAALGDLSAAETLVKAVEVESWQARSQATAHLLEFADRLAAAGHHAEATNLWRMLMETRNEPGEIHVRCAALAGLADAVGVGAIVDIVGAMVSDDAELRAAAQNIAVRLAGAGVTDAFVVQLSASSPAARAGVLEVLTRRGDAQAFPAARAALRSLDPVVRLAAVRATAALGGQRAISPLAEFLDTDRAEEQKAARRALVAMGGETTSTRIAALISKGSPRARVALLEVLADRRSGAQLDVVHRATRDADEEVRIAAINAVGVLADERAAPKLLALFGKAKSKRERGAIESALVATCNRSESPAHRAAPLIAALDINRADDYASLLRVLGRVGGSAAMTAVHNALTDAREPVRDAAFHALTEWPDARVAEQVLEIAANTDPLKHHVLAMRAYARLVGLGGKRSPETMLAMYQAGMKVAQRAEEQKLLLSKLGEVRHERAVAALEPYMTDDRLAAEAASAMINVAEGLLPGGWQPARDALVQVLATSDVDSVRTRAERVMQRVDEFADFVTDWLVAGPYKQKGKQGTEVFDVAFAPELPGEPDVKWKKQPVTKDAARYWFIDLARSVGGSPGAAYLRTNVFSPEQQEVNLELGSDDGIKVWLNGEVVHSNNVLRGCARKQDVVSVTLNKGFNKLLLKVTDNGGGWAACVRVRNLDGGPVEGVYAKAEP